MKQALCFPTLTSEKAKKVLNWLIYGEFTLGFYMYDICRVGLSQAASIKWMPPRIR